ncbi:MAG: hypothetical protein WEE03_01500 [Chloroflexota bacterium]|nr:hypothetical protein [Candidatus Limnocylindria bacterium]
MTPLADEEATRVLNGFQRDARAMLEHLLPALRQRGFYPEALVDGWGDSRDGRGFASTVVLTSPKWLKPTDRTKQLARVRLELTEFDEWTVIVSVVAQPDQRSAWAPGTEAEWWTDLRERIRAQIIAYHDTKVVSPAE